MDCICSMPLEGVGLWSALKPVLAACYQEGDSEPFQEVAPAPTPLPTPIFLLIPGWYLEPSAYSRAG